MNISPKMYNVNNDPSIVLGRSIIVLASPREANYWCSLANRDLVLS